MDEKEDSTNGELTLRARSRDNFLHLRQILQTASDTLREVRTQLEKLEPDLERDRVFIDSIAGERKKLEGVIERKLLEVPCDALDIYVQYGSDPTSVELDGPASTALIDVVQWQMEVDTQVLRTFEELATRVRNQGAQEILEDLVRLLRAQGKRVSLGLLTLRDL